ncbi:hypothetical protein M378DRAFT_87010, partial [Amanita muscaria Koide BX008]
YYEVVGPLPSLVQPPLWRSPETKKKKTGPPRSTGQHKRHVSDSHAGIEDHKRLISRHRHHWARAVTPPGYWDIGFPSTQETEKINEKARSIERSSLRWIGR